MSKVLITGGAGYVGSVVVRKFLDAGEDVRVFDKLYFGDKGLEDVKDKIELIKGDIRDFDYSILDNVKAVVHLAGLSSDPTAEYNPKANYEINYKATEKLARACKKRGVKRFVFASSCSVYYTPIPIDIEFDESTLINPKAPYSRTKHLAEKALFRLANDDFCPVILRKGTIFGWSPKMRYDLVVNAFVKDAFTKGRLTIHAGGRMWRPMLNINDAADAYLLATKAPEKQVKAKIFNVVANNFRVIDLARKVQKALENKKKIELDIQEVGIPRSYRVSGEKFKKLGFRSKTSIAKEATSLWDDLEKGRDFDNPIYYTIRWMEKIKKW